jgi:predicted transcriptional regulator of viral defense system
MSPPAGITGRGRAELAAVLASGRRFITPADVSDALRVDPDAAAKRLSRWAREGWVRRVRRGMYIGVPVDATNPAAWSEDALIVAGRIWSPCYFTGWTSAGHWALTDQVFRTTVLKTAGRVRAPQVHLLDHDYLLAHASDDALHWGLRTEWHGDARLYFADPARTVIDVLDDPKLAGGIRHAAEITDSFLDEPLPRFLSSTATGPGTGRSSSGSATSSKHSAGTRQTWWKPAETESPRAFPLLIPAGPRVAGGRCAGGCGST